MDVIHLKLVTQTIKLAENTAGISQRGLQIIDTEALILEDLQCSFLHPLRQECEYLRRVLIEMDAVLDCFSESSVERALEVWRVVAK